MDRKEIVKALRCSNTVWHKNHTCEGCSYRSLEPVQAHIQIRPDVVIDGIGYWESCDYEQICNDAADALEAMDDGWHDMKKDPEDVPGKDVERYATICEKRHVIAWKEI